MSIHPLTFSQATPPIKEHKIDLAAALAAQEAAEKAAPPPRPVGVPPPRRPKGPVDPFIQKKKPKRL